MSWHERSWISGRVRDHAARQWRRILASSLSRRRPVTQRLRDEARDLQQVLSRLLQTSEPRATATGDSLSRMDLPAGTDWRWRPNVLRDRIPQPALIAPADATWLSGEVSLFHDCPQRGLILRQMRNRNATDLSDYGLRLEVMGFSGSFLSFSLTLPEDALQNLGVHHIIRLDAMMQAERAIPVYARLNVQQGPNTETLLRKMGDPIKGRHCPRIVEFDLGAAELSSRSIEKIWLDLIFEAPFMNAVGLRDVILSRHPRAQI